MDKLELVKRNTEEILTEKALEDLLKKKKEISAYLGIATTGPFHMGYFVPLGKMLDFDSAGIKNIILIANIHAALDDLKCSWDELDKRAEYYKKCIELGLPWNRKPKFVTGSDFQLKKEYIFDALKLSTLSTVKRATRAASEVTRMQNPKVSELIYPVFQALDEEYLKADIQLGGTDQRHILAYAREYLPKVGYKSRVEIMTPLITSLKGAGTKMSASIPGSSIKIYESEDSVKKKINDAYCPIGEIKSNPVIQLYQHLIFPIRKKIKIERPKKFGGDVSIKDIDEFKKLYSAKKLHPLDVKNKLSKELITIFSKARNYFDKNKDLLKSLGKDFQ
ncbi:tyrosine--tRNA ligase [archaeon]|nr:tyrosine--tRNA ligase [archaeon]